MHLFGKWVNTIDDIAKSFREASPYPHVVIDGFFDDAYMERLHAKFPPLNEEWVRYWNPIEKKYALNHFETHPVYNELFQFMQSDVFVNVVKKISDIPNLEADPHLHGAGIHYHPTGGKLDMHLDYSVHPITQKERRVNLIIYVNKEWSPAYGGDLQLWDQDFLEMKQKYYPVYNRAVLFQTNDVSYHGMPQMIQCPAETGRKSIAIYYVSEPTQIKNIRYKAQFRPLPHQAVNEPLRQLYSIRNTTNITSEILNDVYPNWESAGNGFW